MMNPESAIFCPSCSMYGSFPFGAPKGVASTTFVCGIPAIRSQASSLRQNGLMEGRFQAPGS